MKKTVAVLAGCVLAISHDEAQAVTFTPDMWVYEVNLVPESLDVPTYAFADAPLGTTPPIGCTGYDVEDVPEGVLPYTYIDCANGAPFDYIEKIGGLEQFARSGRIGFNSSTILCDGDILIGCPSNAQSTSGTGSGTFYDIVMDVVRGELSYCGFVGYGDFSACYALSPTLVSVFSAYGNVGGASGVWEFGYGGYWSAYYPDNYVHYSGTGQLISSPSVVPLPTPALMLSSALLAFGAFGLRGNRSRRRTQS